MDNRGIFQCALCGAQTGAPSYEDWIISSTGFICTLHDHGKQFSPLTRVFHERYGFGTVTNWLDVNKYIVAFDAGGEQSIPRQSLVPDTACASPAFRGELWKEALERRKSAKADAQNRDANERLNKELGEL